MVQVRLQVIREFKNRYKLHDDDIKYLLDCCSFKKKPKKIKYLDFYKNKLTNECKKISIHLLKYINVQKFLTDDECIHD